MKLAAGRSELKTGFFLGLLFSPEDGGDMFFRFNFTRLHSVIMWIYTSTPLYVFMA
jgi:hypothetical protein